MGVDWGRRRTTSAGSSRAPVGSRHWRAPPGELMDTGIVRQSVTPGIETSAYGAGPSGSGARAGSRADPHGPIARPIASSTPSASPVAETRCHVAVDVAAL